MLSRVELRKIGKARFKDASVLLCARRYDGAMYLCGYAIEIALKARICRTLSWAGYPATGKEFQNYKSFRTHDLDVLLRLCGIEQKIKTDFLAEWSAVAMWNPKARYKPIGNVNKQDAVLMIESARILLRKL